MKKHSSWLRRLYIGIFSGALGLALIFFGLNIYTTRAAIPLIERYAKHQGIDLKINKIDGWFPIRANIDHISYAHKGLGKVKLEDVRVELFKIPVLKRRLRIRLLSAKKTAITLESRKGSGTPSQINWPSPFFGIQFAKLSLEETKLQAPALGEEVEFALAASGLLDRGADHVELKTTITQKKPFHETIQGHFKATKRTRLVEANLKLSEKKNGWAQKFLAPYTDVVSADLDIHIAGHMSQWLSWIRGRVAAVSKIVPHLKGEVKGQMQLASKHKTLWTDILVGENINLKCDFSLSSNQMLHFQNISLTSMRAALKGSAKVNFHEKRVRGADLDIELKKVPTQVSDFSLSLNRPLACKLTVRGAFEALDINASCYKQAFGIAGLNIDNLSGKVDVKITPKDLSAQTDFFCYLENRRFELKGGLTSPDHNIFNLEDLSLTSTNDAFTANGSYSLKDKKWQGGHFDLIAHRFGFFNHLTKALPNGLEIGRIKASGDFHNSVLKWDGTISQFEIGDFYTRTVDIGGEVKDFFHKTRGHISMRLNECSFGSVQFPTLELSTTIGHKDNIFTFNIPYNNMSLEMKSSGIWRYASKDYFMIELKMLDGSLDDHPFELAKGGRFLSQNGQMTLSPVMIHVESGLLTAEGYHSKTPGWQIKLQDIPADFMRLYNRDIKANGNMSGELIYLPTGQKPSALAHFIFNDISVEYQQWPIIDHRSGLFQLRITPDGLKLSASLEEGKRQTLFFSMSLPANITFLPFDMSLNTSKAAQFELKADENAANFLQYLNSEGHALGGHLSGQLQANGSLQELDWKGNLTLTKGRYENYQTGMILQNLSMNLLAKGQKLELTELKADDHTGGTLTAKGSITASPYHHFPFKVSALFDKTQVLNLDDVTASTSGLVQIEGNLEKAKLKAKLNITHANINIPDTIKVTPPSLDVEFIHARKNTTSSFDFAFAKKVDLDIRLDTTSSVEVRGRGLQSKWSGSVHTSGTAAEPLFKGKLDLASGTFKFAKISFNLTEGVISFDGPVKATDISLVAEQQVNDLNVYIALRGPLVSPHLTLSSSPDLPISNLLSRILFNKDISEINPFQALQLAQTAIQISSGEGNVMDRIQDSVGLDVFSFTSGTTTNTTDYDDNVQTQPDDSGDTPPTVAVQVGKYITRGVLLTVTQGTTAESSRYNVDIDLKYGLMLQLETSNQKDGTVSLMWSKSY